VHGCRLPFEVLREQLLKLYMVRLEVWVHNVVLLK
jgi:hypothetical protein